MKVLSLGAGIQSSFLLLAKEEFNFEFDYAIFSDTRFEPKAVYEQLEFLKENSTTPIITVSQGNLKQDILDHVDGKAKRASNLPYYAKYESGKVVMFPRACTSDYKIKPIHRYAKKRFRDENDMTVRGRIAENAITFVLGISSDEAGRCKTSQEKWYQNKYPLVESNINRNQCHDWLKAKYPNRQWHKSACIVCPFHSTQEWKNIKSNQDDWDEAVDFDRKVRELPIADGKVFLHPSIKPIEDAYMDELQPNLWEDECDGYCGI